METCPLAVSTCSSRTLNDIPDSFTAARGRSSEIYDVRRQHQAHGAAEPGPEVRLAGVPETIHGQIEIAGRRVAKVSVVEFPLSVGYEYSDGLPLPAGLPSKFSIYAGEELAGVFQIYRLETSSGDIDDAHFAPEAQLEPGSHFRTVFTRNGVRVADPGEQLEWVKAMKADRTPDFDMSAPL